MKEPDLIPIELNDLSLTQRQQLYAECQSKIHELDILQMNLKINLRKIHDYMIFNGESIMPANTSSFSM